MTQMIRLFLNGHRQDVNIRPDSTVLEWLRGEARLTGTKEGCAEGDCGACSILIGDVADGHVHYHAANSCILTMGQLDGRALVTVEGLAAGKAGKDAYENILNPVQAAMAENGSSQCGFCTPGIVMSLSGLAASQSMAQTDTELTEAEFADDQAIHDALAGNLCRCTGYRPIIEAARKVLAAGGNKITGPSVEEFAEIPAQEHIISGGSNYMQPQTLAELLRLRATHPDAILLAGGTDLGVGLADYHSDWNEVISTAHVAELRCIIETDTSFSFGAAVTWADILDRTAQYYPSLATLIRRFGSTQIRTMGTVGGNIGTASPIGDGPPALIALGAQIELASLQGSRTMPLEDFFLDYRKTELRDDEVIVRVTLPKPVIGQEYRTYKISKRYDQDISTVCGAYSVTIADGKVVDARIAYGGMAAIPKRAKAAEQALIGKLFDQDAVKACAEAIEQELAPLSDWRGSAEYRMQVAMRLIERFRRDLAGETVEVMAL